MGLKKFNADVSAAAEKVAAGSLPAITSLSKEDNNELVLVYRHESLSKDVRIRAVAQDMGEYPDANMFKLSTEEDDTPQPILEGIKAVEDYLFGQSVYELAKVVVDSLGQSFAPQPAAGGDDGDEDGDYASGEDDDDDYDDESDYLNDDNEIFGLPSERPQRAFSSATGQGRGRNCDRILMDLRRVREAGYRVGFLDNFGTNDDRGIVSLSIRIGKLGLSEETMDAWDVEEDDYFVLLIRFEDRYDPHEVIAERPAAHSKISFRVGKCKWYKPSAKQAVQAFSPTNRVPGSRGASDPPEASRGPGEPGGRDIFHRLFLSTSLDKYMDDSFVSLMKIRTVERCSWETANEVLTKKTGLSLGAADSSNSSSSSSDVSRPSERMEVDASPENHQLLACDHLTEASKPEQRSFPLVAMQFAVRYFMRCTEFCLRCHRRLNKEIEALRPYVCSDPLCLFQYMAMGFGPNIEHEITTQPLVVDLLVSLCYAAIQTYYKPGTALPLYPAQTAFAAVAAAGHQDPGQGRTAFPIRSLPVGVHLKVPGMFGGMAPRLSAHWSVGGSRMTFDVDEVREQDFAHLTEGKWIAFRNPQQSLVRHAVVAHVSVPDKYITIEMKGRSARIWGTGEYVHDDQTATSRPTAQPRQGLSTLDTPRATGSANSAANYAALDMAPCVVDVFFYDADFDTLPDEHKGDAMRHILDTLPPILEIEAWLNDDRARTVRYMSQVSPSAAALLQWIVSTNRSCIYQVDTSRQVPLVNTTESVVQAPASTTVKVGRGRNRDHERIPGMDGWIQFRFAQGSPDKELRFNRALQEVAARKDIKKNPTIFAWHGSALPNWHSIIRTGLDYKEIKNARAFGHGVYFSPQFSTSIGYANAGAQAWPNSCLKIQVCMSLNEIINSPEDFVSQSPHYVVSQPDWHQCRYLFVQSELASSILSASTTPATSTPANPAPPLLPKTQVHQQIPTRQIMGPAGKALLIPLSAIPFRQVGASSSKQSARVPAKRAVLRLDSDDSCDDDLEDQALLYPNGDFGSSSGPPCKKASPRSSSPASGRGPVSYVMSRLKSKLKLGLTAGSGDGGRPDTPPHTDRGLTDFEPGTLDLSTLPRLSPPSSGHESALKALSREVKMLQAAQTRTPLHELGWYMDFGSISNLFQWIVELHSFDSDLMLAKDMKKAGVTSIVLEIRFGMDYPLSPPFVRVVRPRFLPFIQGGGGHVTGGGAMCMELLTNSGWSPANSMESVLLQVRMALCNLEPKPARLQSTVPGGAFNDYGIDEAIEAYMRAATAHGWQVPQDLMRTARGR